MGEKGDEGGREGGRESCLVCRLLLEREGGRGRLIVTFLSHRLVSLMTASGHGTEGVAAELLFVLCKEDSSQLIKYTGYGNAAGLLLSYGLLGGGKSDGAADYSSDSEDSETEDYVSQ